MPPISTQRESQAMSYRYIGNKTRLLGPLMEHVRSIVDPPATVADLMCGTASVSAALRSSGYSVIAADIMTYSVHHANVRLRLSRAPYFAGLGLSYDEVRSALEALRPKSGMFFREFSPGGKPRSGCPPRMYFTSENARLIDAMRLQITDWELNGLLTERQVSLLRHDLVLAANAVANIAGTYGHFRSSWSAGALRSIRLKRAKFETGATDHIVLKGPAEEIACNLSADLCYLDPPYMKRQYAANYHLIETIARGDEPASIGVSGLRDWWDQYSDFCSKRRIADAFAAIIGKMDCPHFLVSYSEDGLLTVAQLTRLFEEFGRVRRWSLANKRFKSNEGGAGGTVNEYLFHIEIR